MYSLVTSVILLQHLPQREIAVCDCTFPFPFENEVQGFLLMSKCKVHSISNNLYTLGTFVLE